MSTTAPDVPQHAHIPADPAAPPIVDDIRARRDLRALTLNAAELIRHPGATEPERHAAEQAIALVRLGHLPAGTAHEDISAARAQIRDRWNAAA